MKYKSFNLVRLNRIKLNNMKRIITILVFSITALSFAQNKNARASLEVDGVCMMCKERIETAAIKTKGVKSAQWNVKSHELKLIYDQRKTSIDTIKSNILEVGHDIADLKATEAAYNSVHPCCRYRDAEVKKDHEDEDN